MVQEGAAAASGEVEKLINLSVSAGRVKNCSPSLLIKTSSQIDLLKDIGAVCFGKLFFI